MVRLHVFHAHLGNSPESIDLRDLLHLQETMQFAKLVVIFHLCRNQAILADPRDLLRKDFIVFLGHRFDDPAIHAVHFLFAQERMRIFIDIALAHIVVSEVGTHEVIRLGTLSADAARFLHGGQVKPLVVILADIVVINRQESRTLHIVGITEEHDLLGILAYVHRKRGNLAFTLRTSLVDKRHREFGTARIAIGTVLHLLDDITARKPLRRH